VLDAPARAHEGQDADAAGAHDGGRAGDYARARVA
jgi:hypothetical protein